MKKKVEAPKPDLQSATSTVLERIADWAATNMTNEELFGSATRRTKEEWAVLGEARKLAVNYIRMGAKR